MQKLSVIPDEHGDVKKGSLILVQREEDKRIINHVRGVKRKGEVLLFTCIEISRSSI